jgi:nucleotide-binding universal stress UspA family protein
MKKILVGTDTSAAADLAVEAADRLVDVARAERVDTIVVGNRGAQGSFWRVRESVPNIVLRHAPCSVFIVDTRSAQ